MSKNTWASTLGRMPRSVRRAIARLSLRFVHEPTSLVHALISRSAIEHNIRTFSELINRSTTDPLAGIAIAPVLKSNAYGHGLVQVATIIEEATEANRIPKPPFLVIDSFFEALMLRRAGITLPLHIIGHTALADIFHGTITAMILGEVSYTVGSLEELRMICQKINGNGSATTGNTNSATSTHPAVPRIHIKIDTGMHRQGITMDEIDAAISLIKETPRLVVDGLCSHFADADGTPESLKMTEQIACWNTVVTKWQQTFSDLQMPNKIAAHLHISNTAGAWHNAYGTVKPICNVARIGLGIYGFGETRDALTNNNTAQNTGITSTALRPAMTIETIITGIRTVRAGETIGYNGTFTAPHAMRLATVPMGYYEGVDRRLSNKGAMGIVIPEVLQQAIIKAAAAGSDTVPENEIRASEITCPIVGRVSMNLTIIDVTEVPAEAAVLGARVIVISPDQTKPYSITAIARAVGTIDYEIPTATTVNLKREVVG